jgi:hypothetical protein
VLWYILSNSADLAGPIIHGISSQVCDHDLKYVLATICGNITTEAEKI